MNIGSRIAFLREQRGWTQQQLAGSLGITRAALSHYEQNRRKPDSGRLMNIADLFNVNIDYLLGRTENPHRAPDEEKVQPIEQLELSDEQLLQTISPTIDRLKLTSEEANRFIALFRTGRSI